MNNEEVVGLLEYFNGKEISEISRRFSNNLRNGASATSSVFDAFGWDESNEGDSFWRYINSIINEGYNERRFNYVRNFLGNIGDYQYDDKQVI